MTISAHAQTQSAPPPDAVRPDHTVRWVALFAAIVAGCAYAYFASKGMALGYKARDAGMRLDGISHLQIASRTLNSPTAGFAQLGGVWLPLPHLLMLPLIWFTPFYYSGFAGSAVSMVSYVIACVYVYKMAFGLTHAKIPAVIGLLVFALNPNVLYMQSTPMTELLLFAATSAMAYYVQQWIQTENHAQKYPYVFAAAVAGFLACLTRYEAWEITPVMGVIVLFVAWRQYGRHAMEGVALGFAFLAGAAIVLWLGWNQLIFGNPLNFQNGEYAKPSIWVGEGEYTVGHPVVAVKTYWYAMVENLGIVVALAMIAGAVALIMFRRRLDSLPVLGLLTIAPFFVFTLVVGQRPLHVPPITGDYCNVRFGLLMAVPAGILVAYLISVLPSRIWIVGLVAAAGCTLLPLVPGGPTHIVTAQEAPSEVLDEELETGGFLREHYDGGVILIEGFGNETILFHARISLTNNVYEGSYQKWDPALSNPPGQQIRWIVMRFGDKPDKTYREIYGTYKLKEYNEVFRSSRHVVYERKA
jgi:hypothetical protein